jgi:8-oxo-dGTP diphosphatase
MIIHLVRHAHAGSRADWVGVDSDRPLSEKGRTQSDAIASSLSTDLLALVEGHRSVELWSSPFLRCVQTLEPLGDRLDLKVRSVDELAEGGNGATVLDMLLSAAGEGTLVVACSHGDVIPAVVASASGRGASLDGDPVPRKAARYEVTIEGGSVTHITHIARPEV